MTKIMPRIISGQPYHAARQFRIRHDSMHRKTAKGLMESLFSKEIQPTALVQHDDAVYSRPMTDTLSPCPECSSAFTYQVDALLICPECGHEWSPGADTPTSEVRDSVGNILADGDTVTVIKDLKIKGSSQVVKVGTKVRGIRLVDGDHDIDCKIPGIGQMGLKSQFVKKVVS